MNISAKIALLSLFLLSSCSKAPTTPVIEPVKEELEIETPAVIESTELTADFEATVGGLDRQGEGPWNKRMLLATSTDGLNFTRTNLVFADQANTPSMVVDKNGWIYLYYSGETVGEKINAAGVAISKDNGKTWLHKYVNIIDGNQVKTGTDPDVEILEDGTFRIYFISRDFKSPTPKIYYAEGTDGYNFTYGGVSFEENGDAIDSSTFLIGDLWHQFTLVGNTMSHYHATSEDGKTFTLYKKEDFTFNNESYVMANEIQTDDGVRFYAFNLRDKNFISFFSTDGYTWKVEDGSRLSFDKNSQLESKYIKDPAVAKLADGSYIMAYVTVIPE